MMTTQADWYRFLPILAAPSMGVGAALLVAVFEKKWHERLAVRVSMSWTTASETVGFAEEGRVFPEHAGSIALTTSAISLLTILVTAWASFASSWPNVWISCLFGWWLLTLSIIDAKLFVLPDTLTFGLALCGFAVTFVVMPGHLIDSGIGAAAGFSILALLREGYRQLRGHDGLGLGDAKLLGAVGAWLGWHALSSVVLLAALGGLGIAVIVRLSGRSITPDQKLPFGPFLAAGAWVVWLHGGLTLEW